MVEFDTEAVPRFRTEIKHIVVFVNFVSHEDLPFLTMKIR